MAVGDHKVCEKRRVSRVLVKFDLDQNLQNLTRISKFAHKISKSQQHPKDFPGGPPPQYYPGLSPLNFRVQMGSGVLDEVWPTANA